MKDSKSAVSNFRFRNILKAIGTSISAIALTASCVQASDNSCNVSKIPESIKVHADYLFSGNFEEFFKLVNAGIKSNSAEEKKFSDELRKSFPNGFKSCDVIIAEDHSENYRKGIVALSSEDERIIFYRYSEIRIDGRWMVPYYLVTSSFVEVMGAQK